jgi:hypothetical protein
LTTSSSGNLPYAAYPPEMSLTNLCAGLGGEVAGQWAISIAHCGLPKRLTRQLEGLPSSLPTAQSRICLGDDDKIKFVEGPKPAGSKSTDGYHLQKKDEGECHKVNNYLLLPGKIPRKAIGEQPHRRSYVPRQQRRRPTHSYKLLNNPRPKDRQKPQSQNLGPSLHGRPKKGQSA